MVAKRLGFAHERGKGKRRFHSQSSPEEGGDGAFVCGSFGFTAQLLPLPLVVRAGGPHLFPFRTESLSHPAPMVLVPQGTGIVGHRRDYAKSRPKGRLFAFRSFFESSPHLNLESDQKYRSSEKCDHLTLVT